MYEARLGYQFEDLCADLFRAYGFIVKQDEVQEVSGRKYYYDVLIENEKGEQAIAEIKLYRTRKASRSMLKKAIEKLLRSGDVSNIKNLVLIIGSSLQSELKKELESEYGIVIFDSKNLISLFSINTNLSDRYQSITNDIPKSVFNDIEVEETNINIIFSLTSLSNHRIDISQSTAELLEAMLENIKCGKEDYRLFEETCTEILSFLFEEYLTGWHEQIKTSDDLNRYDLICRIKNGNEFWNFIKEEFKSRYIIFEFKNYCSKIKQTQIYTTEKYLFQTALRNVCFMISREGPDRGAILASNGVLRETGKLIVHLTQNDIIEMLRLKDSGSEPSDYLFDQVDQLLLTLSK